MLALQYGIDGLTFTALLIMLGQSVVLVHRGSGVTNFSAAAVGMVAAYFFYDIWPGHGIPWLLALIIALAAAAAMGVLTYLLVLRPLRGASDATKVIATLGVMLAVTSVSSQYFAPGGIIRQVPSFLPSGQLAPLKQLVFSDQGPIVVGIALGVTLVLWFVLKYTRFGLATTAVCENERVASGMGLSPHTISAVNWAVGTAIAALGMILIAPVSGLDVGSMPLYIVPALGAALIGGFDSLLLTVVGAVVIGVGEAEVGLVTTAAGWNEAAPLIAIIAVLIIRRPPRFDRSDVVIRPPLVGSGRVGALALVGAAACLVAILIAPLSWLNPLTLTLIIVLVMLSVVVVTGYAAQLSLAQFGLAGVGAFFTALFAAGQGVPLWAAMLLGVVVTIPLGIAVSLPALRIKGPSLAIATLALVVVINDLLLNNPSTVAWFKSGVLPPLDIPGLSLNNVTEPRRFAIFCLVVVAAAAVMTASVRRSAMGRRLLAIRTNPQAAQALGISPAAMKVFAFTLGTAMAAACGAVFEAQFAYYGFQAFSALSSVTIVLQGTIGGLGQIGGALIGSTGFPSALGTRIFSVVIPPSNWIAIITGVGVLLVILQYPDGVVASLEQQLAWTRRHVRFLATRPGPKRVDPFAAALEASRVHVGRRDGAPLEVENLSVSFGGVKALAGASLSVEPGELVGLIGPNGAGKSTFIDAVCGSVTAQSGTVTVGGSRVDGLSVTNRSRRGLARSFQSLELFEDMTVGENLLAACEKPGWKAVIRELCWPKKVYVSEAAARACDDFGLTSELARRPRSLDHGRRRMLAIARAFASDPAIIFLDEPAAGLDTQQRAELGSTLRKVASEWNVGIVLVEHDVDLVFRVCDRVTALVAGVPVASGSPDEVRVNPVVTAAYLGVSEELADKSGAGGVLADALESEAIREGGHRP